MAFADQNIAEASFNGASSGSVALFNDGFKIKTDWWHDKSFKHKRFLLRLYCIR